MVSGSVCVWGWGCRQDRDQRRMVSGSVCGCGGVGGWVGVDRTRRRGGW